MVRYLFSLLLLVLVACSPEAVLPDVGPEVPEVNLPVKKTVTISASLEQPEQATRTLLADGGLVLWSSGDAISLCAASGTQNNVLTATVNGRSQGLGIKVSVKNNQKSGYIKYSGILVKNAQGQDVTSEFTKKTASENNDYMVGIYNGNSKYQYVVPGQVVTAQVNSDSTPVLPLVQSSSGASSLPLTIQLTDIQYSLDNKTWVDVNEQMVNSGLVTLVNGFGSKGTVTYTWTGAPVNERFTLVAGGENQAWGDFTGELSDEPATYYAIYPYASENGIDGTNLKFRLPETQTYVEGSFASGANPSAGVYQGGQVQFNNLCGVLSLKLLGTEKVEQITLADKNTQAVLWGEGTVSVADLGTLGASFTGGSNQVILDCGAGVQLHPDTPTSFYFVVPAGSFSTGFTASIQTPFGVATLQTSKSNVVNRSKVRAMPACGIGNILLEEFNIMNEAVEEYMLRSTSTLSASASNYGQSFFDQSLSYRPDQPKVKTIQFEAVSQGAKVQMATDASFQNLVLDESLATGATQYDLRNMVPGNTYYYKVTDGGRTKTEGAFKAVGQLRMIAVEKGFNMRDLGGWTGWNGHKMRYEQIYRGASLGGTDKYGTKSDITSTDKAELYRIGLRAQLDLRAATNEGKYTNETSLHSYSRGETTLTGSDFNNTMTDYGAYDQDESVVSDVAWIIYELKQGKPVYFNCRQGADRTGTIAFIIEGLMGCYLDNTGHQMAMDYELTGFSQANLVDNVKVSTSYRGGSEAATNSSKLFYKLLNLSASGVSLNTLQDKCYYYLNKQKSIHIDKADLDWFVNFMLGITDCDGNLLPGQTTKYVGPSWATSGDNLKTVAEGNANIVNYQ